MDILAQAESQAKAGEVLVLIEAGEVAEPWLAALCDVTLPDGRRGVRLGRNMSAGEVLSTIEKIYGGDAG